MPFVSVKDLHDRTSEILRTVSDAKPVFVTRNGKPVAVIQGITEQELEELVMLNEPGFKKALDEAFADLAAGRVVPLDEAIAATEDEIEGTAHC